MAACLNTVGLIFNILGVVLLFFFAYPQPSFNGSANFVPHDGFIQKDGRSLKQSKADAERQRKRYAWSARGALFLILLGFVFQLAATLWS